MQNCQGVLSSRTFNEDVKQDFHGRCQAGISIKTFFYIGLASTTVELDCQAGLGGWTVKENYEAGL